MNNQNYISELAKRLKSTEKDTAAMVQNVISVMTEQLQDGKVVAVHGFGTLEVKKKMERISVNPVSKKRILVPPKLVLAFKPSNVLKNKIKGVI